MLMNEGRRALSFKLASAAVALILPVAGVFFCNPKSRVSAAETTNAGKRTEASKRNVDWPIYGGEQANNHYSAITQINRKNVGTLRVAWTFDTHEKGGLQTSPLIVGRILYGYTPSQKVIAVDAASGKLIWTFDSGVMGTQPGRGLTYWHEGNESRLFAGVMNYLYALDPETGKPIASFGEDGR